MFVPAFWLRKKKAEHSHESHASKHTKDLLRNSQHSGLDNDRVEAVTIEQHSLRTAPTAWQRFGRLMLTLRSMLNDTLN